MLSNKDYGVNFNEKLIIDLCKKAVDMWGGKGDKKNIFNSACFSEAIRCYIPFKNSVDGYYVKFILAGRPFVERLKGAHWKLIV